jgi:hypothetical protein
MPCVNCAFNLSLSQLRVDRYAAIYSRYEFNYFHLSGFRIHFDLGKGDGKRRGLICEVLEAVIVNCSFSSYI